MIKNRAEAYSPTFLMHEAENVTRFDNSQIGQTTNRIENNKRMRIVEYDTMEYHKKLREDDHSYNQNTKMLRLNQYEKMSKEEKETTKFILKQESKQDQRLVKEYREQQYMTDLFMQGLYLDTIA